MWGLILAALVLALVDPARSRAWPSLLGWAVILICLYLLLPVLLLLR